MTKAQTNLGIIGAVICAGLALNMTDSGQGAIVGGLSGFAIGSMLPRIFELARAFVMIGIMLGILALWVWIKIINGGFLPREGSLHLTNACPEPISVHLRWRGADGNWVGNGPWGFSGNSAKMLTFKDGSPLVLTSGSIYYHAVSQDGRIAWEGENMHQMGGRNFPMRRSDIGKPKEGRYNLSLTCN